MCHRHVELTKVKVQLIQRRIHQPSDGLNRYDPEPWMPWNTLWSCSLGLIYHKFAEYMASDIFAIFGNKPHSSYFKSSFEYMDTCNVDSLNLQIKTTIFLTILKDFGTQTGIFLAHWFDKLDADVLSQCMASTLVTYTTYFLDDVMAFPIWRRQFPEVRHPFNDDLKIHGG